MLFSADSANISLGMRSALRFLAANYYIMFCGASSSNYCTKRQRFYPLPLFFALKRAESPFSFYRQQTADLPPIQRCAAGGGFTLKVSVRSGRLRRPGKSRCSPAGTKGDRTPSMVSCPLLTPLTFLCADTSEMCSETGVTGARFRASDSFQDAWPP